MEHTWSKIYSGILLIHFAQNMFESPLSTISTEIPGLPSPIAWTKNQRKQETVLVYHKCKLDPLYQLKKLSIF